MRPFLTACGLAIGAALTLAAAAFTPAAGSHSRVIAAADDGAQGASMGSAGAGKTMPLVLDLSGTGRFRRRTVPVRFDVYGTGDPQLFAWPDAGAGFLFLDLDGHGCPTDGSELFGDATAVLGVPGRMAVDGFAALAQYDLNHDGVIDGRDPVFSRIKVWVDRKGDGRCRPEDVAPLAAYHVTALHLAHRTAADGSLVGTYDVVQADGRAEVRVLADLMLEMSAD